MPLFAMISSCNMLFDSSEHCNLMLFSAKSELLLFAILSCLFEHVLVISRDSSVFMFCYDLPIQHVHAFCSHVGVLQHVVLRLAICLVAVLDRLLLYLVWSVCVEPLLRLSVLYMKLVQNCMQFHIIMLHPCFESVCLMFVCILHQCHV